MNEISGLGSVSITSALHEAAELLAEIGTILIFKITFFGDLDLQDH